MSTQHHHIQYGETTIEYELSFGRRKTLAISVHPDLRVTVKAPLHAALDEIAAIVQRKAPWIIRQRRELERLRPAVPPRQYRSGETHRYLGRQYRLKLIDDSNEGVTLTRGFFLIKISGPHTPERVRTLLNAWYHRTAARVFGERLEALLPRFAPYGITAPEIRIRPMKSRWGSCTHHGKITLNLLLIQAPKNQIDYVIAHELCHLIEHNHSKRFYALLDQIMPDWRERRQRLNSFEL